MRAREQGHYLMCKIKFEKKNSFLIIASLHEKIDLQLKLIYMRQFSVLLKGTSCWFLFATIGICVLHEY